MVSRYLNQLAIETRAKLRPPSSLKLAPRAAAFIEEIHEERPAAVPASDPGLSATASRMESASENRPAPVQRGVEEPRATEVPDMTTREEPKPSISPSRVLAGEPVRVATPSVQLEAQDPQTRSSPVQGAKIPDAVSERSPAPVPIGKAGREDKGDAKRDAPQSERRIRAVPPLELALESVVVEEIQLAQGRQKEVDFVMPDPARTWPRSDLDRAGSVTAERHAPTQMISNVRVPQPRIDVSIGNIEVTIESEPAPVFRAVRSPETRVPARKSGPPPLAGMLARQYLDR